jgi:hypothetical protein
MAGKGLRQGEPVPKQVNQAHISCAARRLFVSRPLVILAIVAGLALLAGFLAFGGANMGQ